MIEEKKKETEPFSGAQDIEWDIALEEDGTYDIRMTAKDRAGHESRQDRRVIVDQTNPVIRYVDQMQGVYVPYFQWNYGKEEVVQDETDYSYDIFSGREHSTPQGKNNKGRSEGCCRSGLWMPQEMNLQRRRCS